MQETVADLNKQVPEDIPLNRFRPNIVVAGGEPWAEDSWEVLDCRNPPSTRAATLAREDLHLGSG